VTRHPGEPAGRPGSVASSDGTRIGFVSLGSGPGLIIIGGVLSSASEYLPLARVLATAFTVHVMDRRGRPSSGPQRAGHSIDDECADLAALAMRTGATAAFGHSFGGLVALETAWRHPGLFTELFLYEPGVPLRGHLRAEWLDGYEARLQRGDRRGAFAWMVKHAGFAPRPLEVMPLWFVRAILRLAQRPHRWAATERLLDANLGEHRIQATLEAATADRFSTITARTVLLGGARSPAFISRDLITELAGVIPNATAHLLPALGHPAPEEHPERVAAALLAQSRT
jgi:pimeloyl-ACP methyl ester carboxylesterase